MSSNNAFTGLKPRNDDAEGTSDIGSVTERERRKSVSRLACLSDQISSVCL